MNAEAGSPGKGYKVRVRNFQSIVDAQVVIDGFTVITGTNNAGKSALMRAIKGVFTNPPPTFVREGADHSIVDITFPDGNYIKWEKGTKINQYHVNGKSFKKVGRSEVPEAVRELGFFPIIAGGLSVWPQFADQFPNPKKGSTGALFLLDLPGSAIADAVADVERIQKLNVALKACESDRKSAVGALKLRHQDSERLQKEMDRFGNLDETVDQLGDLEAQRVKIERVTKAHDKLTTMREQWVKLRDEVEHLNDFESISVPNELDVKEIEDLKIRRQVLIQLQEKVYPLQVDAKNWAVADKVTCSVELGNGADVRKANKIRQGRKLLRTLKKQLEGAQAQILRFDDELVEKEENLQTAQHEVHSILGGYNECPVCNSVLSHESVL